MSSDPFTTLSAKPRMTNGNKQYLAPELPEEWDRKRPIKPPEGPDKALTRVTTFVKAVKNTYSLEMWGTRMAIKGMSLRPDLYALCAATDVNDREALDNLAGKCKDAAAAGAGAVMGDALHKWTEQWDLGLEPKIPLPWREDIAAYAAMLAAYRITVVPAWTEHRVLKTGYGIPGKDGVPAGLMGRYDRIVMADVDAIRTYIDTGSWPAEFNPRPVVLDVKSGKNVDYQLREIAVQMWCYATADAIWDGEFFHPMPDIDARFGLVAQLFPGTGSARLRVLDLSRAQIGADVCQAAREWLGDPRAASVSNGRLIVCGEEAAGPAHAGPPTGAAGPAHAGPPTGAAVPAHADPPTGAAGPAHAGPPTGAAVPAHADPPTGAAGPPAAGRKCRKCGNVGHNARTCTGPAPVVVLMSALPEETPETPWCACTSRSRGWTDPGTGGAWVCGDCGLPSRAGQLSGTGPAEEGQLPAGEDDPVLDPFATASGPAGPAPAAEWKERIETATTREELKEIRARALAAGEWTDEMTEMGKSLISEGRIT